jgi:hypothetical protein
MRLRSQKPGAQPQALRRNSCDGGDGPKAVAARVSRLFLDVFAFAGPFFALAAWGF